MLRSSHAENFWNLCNMLQTDGPRFIVRSISQRLLQAEMFGDNHDEKDVLIPQIKVTQMDSDFLIVTQSAIFNQTDICNEHQQKPAEVWDMSANTCFHSWTKVCCYAMHCRCQFLVAVHKI